MIFVCHVQFCEAADILHQAELRSPKNAIQFSSLRFKIAVRNFFSPLKTLITTASLKWLQPGHLPWKTELAGSHAYVPRVPNISYTAVFYLAHGKAFIISGKICFERY